MADQEQLREAYLKRVLKTVSEAELKVKSLTLELIAAQAVLKAAKRELEDINRLS